MSALELTAPQALWGLALALPIFLFHLYHRRRVTLVVPFLPLLLESTGPARSEARFKRLREMLSFLLRLLALSCAVLALAGLRPAVAHTPPRDLFLVLDADLTSATREADGTPRIGRALALAEAYVRAQPGTGADGARMDAPVTILLARETPRLLVAPSRDRAHVLERLALTVPPCATDADLEAAVQMAVDAGRARPLAHIVVLSARPLPLPGLPAHVTLEVSGVGSAREDQGIIDVALERTRDEPAYRVRLTVRNDAATVRTRTLRIRVGAETVVADGMPSAGLTLEPGVTQDISFRVPAPAEAAWLEVRLVGADVFPTNDAVYARLAPVPRPSVLVVHGGTVRPYTAAVMRALVQGGFVDGTRSGYVRAADLPRAGPRDVILVDGVGLDVGALRPGAYVFLAPLSGALPFDLGARVSDPLLWRTETNHPLLRGLDFRRAFVLRGRTLAGADLTPLAFAEGRPVIGEGERAGVRYVVLGLDPEGSALPAQTALPDFVRRAILRLARAPVAPLAPLYRRGEVLRPRVPLPGGPEARVAWSGPRMDPVLRETGAGSANVRIAPAGASWRVPPGASGRATVRTVSRAGGAGSAATGSAATGPSVPGGGAWTGYTALFDGNPARTVVPVRAESAAPSAAAARIDPQTHWRRILLALAAGFLLLDLLAVARRRPSAAGA